jgi:hypothetical protein
VSVALVMDSRFRAVLSSNKVIASVPGTSVRGCGTWCSGLLARSLVVLRPPWRTTLGQSQLAGTTIRTRVQRGLSDYSNRFRTVSNAKPGCMLETPKIYRLFTFLEHRGHGMNRYRAFVGRTLLGRTDTVVRRGWGWSCC